MNLDFSDKKVLVIGDICLDRNRIGDVAQGSSREANIPIIRYVHGKPGHREEYNPGGGGNLAVNLASLGSQVSVVGVIGKDYAGRVLDTELRERGISTQFLFTDQDRATIVFEKSYDINDKTQPIGRWDAENNNPISSDLEFKITQLIMDRHKDFNAIIAIDYCEVDADTAVVTSLVLQSLSYLKGKTLIFGSSRNRIGQFNDFYCLVPNGNETARAARTYSVKSVQEEIPLEEATRAGRKLLTITKATNIVTTLGEKGAILFSQYGDSHIPAKTLKGVIDTCGCGDTFLATLTLANISGFNMEESMELANLAAGTTALKLGTTGSPTIGELEKVLER